MKLNDYSYEDIVLGKVYGFKRVITAVDMDAFAGLTGDFNPLHCDERYAESTIFEGRIAHGMLAGSLFSTLVGMVCPGKRCLYLSQSLDFRRPIYPDTELVVQGTVKQKIDSVKMVILETKILVNDEQVITGEAKVRLQGD